MSAPVCKDGGLRSRSTAVCTRTCLLSSILGSDGILGETGSEIELRVLNNLFVALMASSLSGKSAFSKPCATARPI